MSKRVATGWGVTILVSALLLLGGAGGCDDPFSPPEDPRSPVPPQALVKRRVEPRYVTQEEMATLYNFLQVVSAEAGSRAERARRLKDAQDPQWHGEWVQWQSFYEQQERLIKVKQDMFRPEPYQSVPGHPLPCLSLALNYLSAVINAYGLNLGTDRPMEPQLLSDFESQTAKCKQLLDEWEPAPEFSGTPPPEIR